MPGGWYMSSAVDETRFAVYAVPTPEVSLDQLEDMLDRAIAGIVDEALDEKSIARAKTQLIAETTYAADSQTSMARIYGAALAIGETIDSVRSWPADIEAVTHAELAEVARRYLVPRRAVTGHLLKAG